LKLSLATFILDI